MDANSMTTRKTPGDTGWFTADRFGMFIHWGLYAMPARHEWIKTFEKISEEKYDKYFKYFDPDLYNPQEWARMAKKAGMKYMVVTAKHHEGFCLWDSRYTDYKAVNTPAGRDLLAPLLDAFRAEGLKVGVYYSLIDWHHPDFPIDMLHPRNTDPGAFESNTGKDIKKYARYMRDQITELLTGYGKIDLLFFDFSYESQAMIDAHRKSMPHVTGPDLRFGGKGKDDWESEELIGLARKLQPHLIINNRTGIEQDVWNPEQYMPESWVLHEETGEKVVWETCHTFSGSWGYNRDELTWKSKEMLVKMLIDSVSCGGNLLLNVGPTARCELDARAMDALEGIGEWMHYHSRSIYGCTQSAFKAPRDCRFTQKGNRLYLHIYSWPFRHLKVEGLLGKVDYAQFLYDGSEVLFNRQSPEMGERDFGNDLMLELPAIKPNVLVPVIELFLKEED